MLVRHGMMNLDNFLQHENQAYPQSLSLMGKLRLGTKSNLVESLEGSITSEDGVTKPYVEVTDGTANKRQA